MWNRRERGRIQDWKAKVRESEKKENIGSKPSTEDRRGLQKRNIGPFNNIFHSKEGESWTPNLVTMLI